MIRVLVLALVGGLAVAGAAFAQSAARTISVTGEATVSVAPDMAIIRLGVTHDKKDAQEAMDATSAGVARILERLDTMKIEKRDIQTTRFSLHPVWSNQGSSGDGRRRITGFVASNIIAIRIRDLTALGGILNEVAGDGANEFQGLQFLLEDSKAASDQARGDAVKDAMDRAAQLAGAAGVSLGPVQLISENGSAAVPVRMEMAALRSADVPIAAGEVSLSATVTMVFSILD